MTVTVYAQGTLWPYAAPINFDSIGLTTAGMTSLGFGVDNIQFAQIAMSYQQALTFCKFKGRVHTRASVDSTGTSTAIFTEMKKAADAAQQYGFHGITVDELSIPFGNTDQVEQVDAIVTFRNHYPSLDLVIWVKQPERNYLYLDSGAGGKAGITFLNALKTYATLVVPEFYVLSMSSPTSDFNPPGWRPGVNEILTNRDCDFGYINRTVEKWNSIAPNISDKMLIGISSFVGVDLRGRYGFHYEGHLHLRDMIKWYAGKQRPYYDLEGNAPPPMPPTAGLALYGLDYLDAEQLATIDNAIRHFVIQGGY